MSKKQIFRSTLLSLMLFLSPYKGLCAIIKYSGVGYVIFGDGGTCSNTGICNISGVNNEYAINGTPVKRTRAFFTTYYDDATATVTGIEMAIDMSELYDNDVQYDVDPGPGITLQRQKNQYDTFANKTFRLMSVVTIPSAAIGWPLAASIAIPANTPLTIPIMYVMPPVNPYLVTIKTGQRFKALIVKEEHYDNKKQHTHKKYKTKIVKKYRK